MPDMWLEGSSGRESAEVMLRQLRAQLVVGSGRNRGVAVEDLECTQELSLATTFHTITVDSCSFSQSVVDAAQTIGAASGRGSS